LQSRRYQLQYVSIVFDRPRLVLGSMPHFLGIFQNGNKPLNLLAVEYTAWYSALGSEPFQQPAPFIPFTIRGMLYGPFVRLERDRELISSNEVICALRKYFVNDVQNSILLVCRNTYGELNELFVQSEQGFLGRHFKELAWSTELIAIR
jgi:hypothetical protein